MHAGKHWRISSLQFGIFLIERGAGGVQAAAGGGASSSSPTCRWMRRAGHVDLDLVAGLHECERAADEALRRHVQDAGAVAGAAHARVGDAQHVAARPPSAGLVGIGSMAPFRHAGAALRAAVLEHQHVVGRDIEIVALDLARHVVVVLEGDRLAAVPQDSRGSAAGRLHHAAARRQVAREHGARSRPRHRRRIVERSG